MKGVGFKSMFEEAAKKQQLVTANPEDYYPKLLVSKAKRASLYIFIPIIVSIVSVIVYQNMSGQYDWKDMLIPVISFASLIIFLPISEHWSYRPWQSGARQMERELKE